MICKVSYGFVAEHIFTLTGSCMNGGVTDEGGNFIAVYARSVYNKFGVDFFFTVRKSELVVVEINFLDFKITDKVCTVNNCIFSSSDSEFVRAYDACGRCPESSLCFVADERLCFLKFFFVK